MEQENSLLYCASPSKINLFLKVTGKRANGYHELESLFLPLAEPCDDIAIDTEAAPGTITAGSSDVMLPGGMANIAGKAAEVWSKRACVMPHWDINIVKNIPVAAGMGGGSSDAATVLKLLNEHAGNILSAEALAEAALTLGADVPFFLDPKPSIMTGIGEISTPLDFSLPDLNILLLAPGFPVSAAEGYRLLPQESIKPLDKKLRNELLKALKSGDLDKIATLLFNDLQTGVFHKYPILPILTEAMKKTGALTAMMTGSGPTLFGIYANKKSRNQAMEELSETYPEYRVIAAEQL